MDDAPRRIYEGRTLYTRKYIADYKLSDWVKRPAIFMPKSAGRITLEITGVKVEYINAITIEDIIAEGITSQLRGHDATVDLFDKFVRLWDSINAKKGYGWEVNPWVWALTFKVS